MEPTKGTLEYFQWYLLDELEDQQTLKTLGKENHYDFLHDICYDLGLLTE